ncbi:hypothetical protein [Amycolatopsis sp. RTGN1]|uniref:hypothetical protein n=1 Tax=Amycolatopsis ponsaeliensis TaxID=2992142 RepID=UPI0025506B61|nr:hypothetical protein [Amycolatopsis sp. RTGN1]
MLDAETDTERNAMEHPERLVVVVLFDRIDLLDVTGPAEVFSLLQRELDSPAGYRVLLAAETPDPVTTSAGCACCPTSPSRNWPARRSTAWSCRAR